MNEETFSKHELRQILALTHRRAGYLIDLWCDANSNSFRLASGEMPSKAELDDLKAKSDQMFTISDRIKLMIDKN